MDSGISMAESMLHSTKESFGRMPTVPPCLSFELADTVLEPDHYQFGKDSTAAIDCAGADVAKDCDSVIEMVVETVSGPVVLPEASTVLKQSDRKKKNWKRVARAVKRASIDPELMVDLGKRPSEKYLG
ncbi:hypothetical protein ACOSQ2_028800 [Xanthoceras sorbifolium]